MIGDAISRSLHFLEMDYCGTTHFDDAMYVGFEAPDDAATLVEEFNPRART